MSLDDARRKALGIPLPVHPRNAHSFVARLEASEAQRLLAEAVESGRLHLVLDPSTGKPRAGGSGDSHVDDEVRRLQARRRAKEIVDGLDELTEEAWRAHVEENLPVLDWHELWADESEEEWIAEPLLPARRLISVYSAPKVGKSLLLLELAAAIARGQGQALDTTLTKARNVLYIDFENDPRGGHSGAPRGDGVRP